MSFDALKDAARSAGRGIKTGGSAVLGPKGAGAVTGMGKAGTGFVLGQAALQTVGGAVERAAQRRNARLLRQRSEVELAQARREGKAISAQGRAGTGKSGTEGGSGMSQDVALATAEALEMRAIRIAYPFLAEAAAMEAEGNLALYGGITEGMASILGAGIRSRISARGPSGLPPAPTSGGAASTSTPITPVSLPPSAKKRPLGAPAKKKK